MATINLRDFYPWYTHDEYIEVSEEVAEELRTDKRYEKAYRRRVYRNKAHYTIDADNGIEASACFAAPSFHEALEYGEMMCKLCRALNSLPEKQGRRIEAHYLLGKSKVDIAKAEGVSEKNVRQAIERGLLAMKKYIQEHSK